MSPRGGSRKGAGRPRSDTTRNANLNIRTTPERLQAWREAAARADMLLSPWVELMLDRAANK